jgi:hypothetical protein
MTALSARAEYVIRALAVWPRRRIQLTELWRLLDEADPATRTDIRRRRVLSELIEELSDARLVELPSAESYDRTELPALPRFLTIAHEEEISASSPQEVWHPALAWVPGSRLTRSQHETLRRVNRWLYRNRDDLVVPSRERSLEIFGDEKAMDGLIGTTLFGAGRLSLELLRCRRVAPRFHHEPCGDGDILLVVENSDTYDSVLSVLLGRSDHRVSAVGWGAGTGFEASVLSIGRMDDGVREVRYFGDLDEIGLRVPGNATALAVTEGLPPIYPAPGLYAAMLRLGSSQPGQRSVRREAASGLAAWLAEEHRQDAIRLLVSGERLAQESVGLAYLSRNDDWLSGLT